MRLSDFDYNLPKELIAQYPAEKRDESRLLILHRDSGKIEHRIFKDIVEYLNPRDLLVLNDTKVVPAKLWGKKETGGKIEVLVLDSARRFSQDVRSNSNEREEYETLLKPTRGCKVGSKIIFGDGELKADVVRIENGRRFLKFDCNGDLEKALDKLGEMPLPPYIKRQANNSDIDRYQTVYASKNGAIAAPTAGLHFTEKLLEDISKKGVDIEYITLHVGYGTFKPVQMQDIKEHKMEKEYFEVENKVIERLSNNNGRVISVGTTSARVLESAFPPTRWNFVPPRRWKGWTNLFIYPGYKFKVVDALLTNFHLPKTTLLILVAAFCGVGNGRRDRSLLFKAYEEAIKEKYRFYSYGDAMLIV